MLCQNRMLKFWNINKMAEFDDNLLSEEDLHNNDNDSDMTMDMKMSMKVQKHSPGDVL